MEFVDLRTKIVESIVQYIFIASDIHMKAIGICVTPYKSLTRIVNLECWVNRVGRVVQEDLQNDQQILSLSTTKKEKLSYQCTA